MKLPAHQEEFDLTEDLLNGFKAKYPQLDVMSEVYKINLWLHKNPARRPKLMLRFIEKWLGKVKPKDVKLHVVGGKMSEQELLNLGRKHGMEPKVGESWDAFNRRLMGAIK